MNKKKSKFEKHSCNIKNEAECEEEMDEEFSDKNEEENSFFDEDEE